MAKSKEELKAVLMAQEVYMPDGETPNPTKLNIISGAVIPLLIDAIPSNDEHNMGIPAGTLTQSPHPAVYR